MHYYLGLATMIPSHKAVGPQRSFPFYTRLAEFGERFRHASDKIACSANSIMNYSRYDIERRTTKCNSIGFFDDEIDITKLSLTDKFPTTYDNI
jgi:hypothetical protein